MAAAVDGSGIDCWETGVTVPLESEGAVGGISRCVGLPAGCRDMEKGTERPGRGGWRDDVSDESGRIRFAIIGNFDGGYGFGS